MKIWYQKHWSRLLLKPLSFLYRGSVQTRYYLYKSGFIKSTQFSVPVIVVGNVSVGGTGKTPLVAWLVNWLKQQGYRPGIVSRGYGGKAMQWPVEVFPNSDPQLVGDEPVLLVQKTQSPMVVGPNRVAAVAQLLASHSCNVVVSDDGLQHYALARDCEIAVFDAQRKFGNELCLPAGPLREPLERLSSVDFVICNGVLDEGVDQYELSSVYSFQLAPEKIYNLVEPTKVMSPPHNKKIHAIAGIGNPKNFFDTLKNMGFEVIPHEFPDHHLFRRDEIDFKDFPVIMTEKDAVKCVHFANNVHWALPVIAQPNQKFIEELCRCLQRLKQLKSDL